MAKTKLKWIREGADNHEDLYLVTVEQAAALADVNSEVDFGDVSDSAIAWIQIAYDRTRFYNGRGGEGTSRPDSYVACVRDTNAKHKSRVLTNGADGFADIGGILSTQSVRSFSSLRAAKTAIATELQKMAKE